MDLLELLQLVAREIWVLVRRRVIETGEKAELLLAADLPEKIVGLDSCGVEATIARPLKSNSVGAIADL